MQTKNYCQSRKYVVITCLYLCVLFLLTQHPLWAWFNEIEFVSKYNNTLQKVLQGFMHLRQYFDVITLHNRNCHIKKKAQSEILFGLFTWLIESYSDYKNDYFLCNCLWCDNIIFVVNDWTNLQVLLKHKSLAGIKYNKV
mgnify:CR=1 FL=1